MARQNKKKDEEREKLKTTIIVSVFAFALLAILAIIAVGISSPYGLENYFKSLWQSFLEFLSNVRFKLDIFFRFFKSIFER